MVMMSHISQFCERIHCMSLSNMGVNTDTVCVATNHGGERESEGEGGLLL